MQYKIELIDDVAHVQVFNPPNLEEAKAILDHLKKAGIYRKRVIEFKNGVHLLHVDATRLAHYSRQLFVKESKLAFVATDMLSFGKCRMYQAYREDDRTSLHVSTTLADALQWINRN